MEKITLLLPSSTVQMLHLLARTGDQTIGAMVQEMALDRYMNQAMQHSHPAKAKAEDSKDFPAVLGKSV